MSQILSQLGNGDVAPPTPVVTLSEHGYAVTWPAGRPAQFLITTDLFEAMVKDINEGRQAVAVLLGITEALKAMSTSTVSSTT